MMSIDHMAVWLLIFNKIQNKELNPKLYAVIQKKLLFFSLKTHKLENGLENGLDRNHVDTA